MTRNPIALLAVFLLSITTVADMGCEGSSDEPQALGEEVVAWSEVRTIIGDHCVRCHSENRWATYLRFQTLDGLLAKRDSIPSKIEPDPPNGNQMPFVYQHSNGLGCTPDHPQLNDKRLGAEEIGLLQEFLGRDDLLDIEDDFEPLEPPAIPELASATEYTSSVFPVVNDGYIRDASKETEEFMAAFGYDERDFDLMEDHFFCIIFDPGLGEDSYITGLQPTMGIGQIYMNSAVYIDPTGASETARAAADVKGPDWYECDNELGFADAIQTWRFPVGVDPVRLPSRTGLRVEAGSKLVVRYQFHTHWDAEEFMALGQPGAIDRAADTITWQNQVSLRVRWAAPAEITREMKWLLLGPQSQAERSAFSVPTGESTATFTVPMPADDGASRYLVFSAEVGTGKDGISASVQESRSSTCIQSVDGSNPKVLAPAIFDESDAPRLNSNSELNVRCSYRSSASPAQTWASHGAKTFWGGRGERCAGPLFYYERAE